MRVCLLLLSYILMMGLGDLTHVHGGMPHPLSPAPRVASAPVLSPPRAVIAGGAAILATPGPAVPCAWVPQTDTRAVDLNAHYWHIDFRADPATAFTITATYPSDRYTSFAVYTTTDYALTSLHDTDFHPDPDSVNPLLSGTPRGTGTYTLRLMIGPVTGPPVPNTIYAPVPAGITLRLYYRVYLPDAGATFSGNVQLPVVTTYRLTDGTPVACPQPTQPIYGHGLQGLSPPPGFYRPPPDGAYPNMETAYLFAILPITSTPYVVRFRAPSVPHTLSGGIEATTGQVRYWSLCAYDALTGAITVCTADEQTPVNQAGVVTAVLGATGMQPANATAAKGIQWIDLGAFDDPQAVVIRHTLPAPDFTQSAFAVPISATAGVYMGPYAPTLAQCGTAQFETDQCRPLVVANPATGVPFQALTLTGVNVAYKEPVAIYWDSRATAPLTTTVSTGSGSFAVQLTIPQAVSGAHTLIAVGQNSQIVATTPLTLTPLLAMRPMSGTVGSPARASGFGFGSAESVKIWWDTPLQLLATVTSTTVGAIGVSPPLTLTVPSGAAAGLHHIYGVGQTTRAIAVGQFTVR